MWVLLRFCIADGFNPTLNEAWIWIESCKTGLQQPSVEVWYEISRQVVAKFVDENNIIDIRT